MFKGNRTLFMFTTIVLCSISLSACSQSSKQALPLVEEGASLMLIADDFSFTEGPAVDENGDVYFTDQPNNKIHVWSAASKQ